MTAQRIELERYRHPLVRDLAWLLQAPTLLAAPCPGPPTPAELGLGDREAWLDDLERDPGALETALVDSLTRRLGHYHERLWHFLLDHAPATTVLTHNLAVRDGKRTLGELDLLYQRQADATPTHLEVAVKFYLGLPHGPGDATALSRWIGTGGIDSLALKRSRLLDHQLPMIACEQLRPALAEFIAPGIDIARAPLHQRLALLGVLFYPWSAERPAASALATPAGAGAHHLRGDWLHWHAWPAYRDHHAIRRAARLCKPHWLAPPPCDALLDIDLAEAQLTAHFAAATLPVQLVVEGANGRQRRVMVVADRWPEVVPLPPPRRPRRRTP